MPSTATAAVLPGIMHNRQAPVVTGHAVVGRTLHTSNGTWSVTPDAYPYQWYAGDHAIQGATDATYHPTAAEAGLRIHAVVTAQLDGYTSESSSSRSTDRVVLGRVSFDQPTIRGHAVVGHTITAHLADVEPSSATAHYRWYRDGDPIHGARDAAYVVQEADLGHSLHVVVTMRADHWVSRTKRSTSVTDVRTHAATARAHHAPPRAGLPAARRSGPPGWTRSTVRRRCGWATTASEWSTSPTGSAADCSPRCGTGPTP